MGGLLLMAGVTGLSFFFRSGGFGSLLGYEPLPTEAIGFPFEIWNDSKTYRGFIGKRKGTQPIAFGTRFASRDLFPCDQPRGGSFDSF